MDDTETKQWWALMGAMLVSKEVREFARKSLSDADVPKEFIGMWGAIGSGDAGKVWDECRSLGLPDERQSVKSVALGLVRSVSAKALGRFVKVVLGRAQFQGKADLTPDQVATTLESWAAQIRAKVEGGK